MIYPDVTGPITPDELLVAYGQVGLVGLIDLGYFHAIAGSSDSARLFTVTVPVVGDVSAPNGSSFVQGTLDYSTHNLTEAPLLLGFVGSVTADHVPSVTLYDITATSCRFIARQEAFTGPSAPLDSTLNVVALR